MGLHDKVAEGFDGCHLCLGLYKTPKILNCLHSFCVGCLEEELETTQQTNQLICPSCRQVTQLRYRGIHGLTTNTFIMRKQYLKGLHLQVQSNHSSCEESLDENSGSDADISSESVQVVTEAGLPDSTQRRSSKEDVSNYRVNPPSPPITAPANYFDFGCSTHKNHEKMRTRHLRNELEDKAMNVRSEILGVTDSIDVIIQYVNNWSHRKSDMRSKIQHRSFLLQKQIQDEETGLLEQLNNLPTEKEFLLDANTKKQELHTSLKASLQAIAFTRQILSEGTEDELNELGDIVKQRLQRNLHEDVFLNIPEFKLDQPQTDVSTIVSKVFGEIVQTTNERKIYSPQTFYEIHADTDPDDDLQVFETETILISTSDFSKIKSPSVDKKSKFNVSGQQFPARRPEDLGLEFIPYSPEQKTNNDKEESNTFNRFMNLRSSLREKRNKILRAHSDSSNPSSPIETYNWTSTATLPALDAQHPLTKIKSRQSLRRHHTFHTLSQPSYMTSETAGTPSSNIPENRVTETNGSHDINGNSQSLLTDKQDTAINVSSVRDNIRRRKGTWRSLTLS